MFKEVLFFDHKIRASYIVKRLIYAGLTPGTSPGYQAAIKSLHGKRPWPATVALLEEWGPTGPTESWDQHRKGKARSSLRRWGHYLSALRSYHMEHELPIEVFQSLRLKQHYEAESNFFRPQKLSVSYFYHQRDLIQNLSKHPSQYKWLGLFTPPSNIYT